MPANWFEDLFGFRERSYDETKKNLEMMGATLRSRVNQRSYVIGELTTPSLGELRDEAAPLVEGRRGRLKVSNISGDVMAVTIHPAKYRAHGGPRRADRRGRQCDRR